MKKRLTAFIEKNYLFSPDEQLLVAVSGGVDSMVLCDLLKSCDYIFSVAHCNFQLRGADSDADENFVKDYCKTPLIPCFTKKFDTLEMAEAAKKSIQETARDLRYAWFSELLNEHSHLKYLVTAHHASDNVETILYRLAKGTGLNGLTGISVKDSKRRIVRPLLFAFKNEILDYAKKNGIAYREDSSNASDKYRRNYIRHHIVPAFENINPAFEKTMEHSIDVFKDIFSFYLEALSASKINFVRREKELTIIDWEKLTENIHKKLLLYEFLTPFNFNYEQVIQIIAVLEKDNESGKKFFSDTHELLLNRKEIILRDKNFSKKNSEKTLKKNFFKSFPENKFSKNYFELSFIFEKKKIIFSGKKIEIKNSLNDHSIVSGNKTFASFDACVLKFPLIIRSPKAGDKFQPLGMNGQSKLVSDFLRSIKLSEFEKEKQLLLTDADNNIVWVIGQRIDDRYKISKTTSAAWEFSVSGELGIDSFSSDTTN